MYYWKLHDAFILLIRQHRLLVNKYMAAINAQPEHFRILSLLKSGPRSQREICDEVCTKPSTVSIVVARMAKTGLVQKSVSPDSSRTNCITITPAGLEKLEQMRSVIMKIIEISFKDIPHEDISVMISVFEKMKQNLQDDMLSV